MSFDNCTWDEHNTNKMNKISTILIFILFYFQSCGQCTKTIKYYVNSSGCDTVNCIRVFADCKDSLTYSDTCYCGKYVCSIASAENGKKNGKETGFDSDGKVIHMILYDHDKKLKSIEKLFEFTEEFVYLNDSLEYYKKTNEKKKIIEEGHYLNGSETGEWKFYDTITEETTIVNYIPRRLLKSNVIEDENNPGFFVAGDYSGLLDGKWKRYNKEGVLLETKTYKKGIEIKN